MEDQENILRESIEEIDHFFKKRGKNENSFYKLYSAKYPNQNVSHNDMIAENFDTNSIEESLYTLDSDLRRHGKYAKEFIVLKHFATKKDGKPLRTTFKNPFFDATIQRGYRGQTNNSINGINNIGSTTNNMLMELLKEHHKNTSELKDQVTDLRHTYQLEKMEDRIAGLEETQRTPLDSIGDFFQTELGQNLAIGILGLVQQKQNNPIQKTIEKEAEKQPQQPQPQQHTDRENSEEQQKITKLNDSIVRMDSIFKGEGIDAIYELAIFCQQNPELAKTFRTKNQTKNEF